MNRKTSLRHSSFALALLISSDLAQAQAAPKDEPEAAGLPSELQSASIASQIPALASLKKSLLDAGLNFQLAYAGEIFGNPTGGIKQGVTNEGLLEIDLDGDLDKIASLKGTAFHISSFVFHGRGLSLFNILNLSTVSSYEELPTARLFESWAEQQLFEGSAAFRFGQLSADTEFFISDIASALFINGTFGWPIITGVDLPGGGGPNYPLATPGARLKIAPNDHLTLLASIFNGDPSGAGFTGLQQIIDPSGINFRLRDPPFVIIEAQIKYTQGKDAEGLAGGVKLGAWHHFGKFNDQRFDINGVPLASPSSSGVPSPHRGDTGIYSVLDQMIWRLPGDDPKKGVGAFARASAAPSDRNLVDFYTDGGVTFTGLWDLRPNDAFGVAASFARISSDAIARDVDADVFTQSEAPIRSYEIDFELSYSAQIMPGLLLRPTFQYVLHPGGGGPNPFNPALRQAALPGRIPDAAVFGMRTAVRF